MDENGVNAQTGRLVSAAAGHQLGPSQAKKSYCIMSWFENSKHTAKNTLSV